MKKNEQGFILVTSLVLLSILTLVGVGGTYKSMIEMKVTASAADMDKAASAANSGLTQIYWYLLKDATGQTVRTTLKDFLQGNAAAPAIYQGSLTPPSLADRPSDATIKASTSIKVFNITATNVVGPVANKTWGTGKDPQVAVWLTTFKKPAKVGDYPYAKPIDHTTGSCVNCNLVMYALGRSGHAKKLVRETQSVWDNRITGVSAMSNAPAGHNFTELCAATAGTTGTIGPKPKNAWPLTSGSGNNSTVLEVSQAPYVIGAIPSGTAITSNTYIATGKKTFRKKTASKTQASFASAPILVYSGHDTKKAFKADYANGPQDATAVNLPAKKLPTKLVNAPVLGTADEMLYFTDPSKQLFDMDTYRWAAEQFTCQDPTQADGEFGNGKYCSKAEHLRQALRKMGYLAYAPVTGRLTIAQFQYNVANSIPMFGMVRLMFPAVPTGTSTTCNGVGVEMHVIESAGDQAAGSYDFNKLRACNKKKSDCHYGGSMIDPYTNGGMYVFTPADGAKPDNDGDLGPNARLIVYGTILIDYFADYDIVTNRTGGAVGTGTNSVFEPVNGERLLDPLESPDVYLAIEHNIMINPVMPRFGATKPRPFPTAAATLAPAGSKKNLNLNGSMNMMYSNAPAAGANVALASPYDGYFPWAEGLVGPDGVGNTGTMRLMSRATTPDITSKKGLVDMIVAVGRDTEQITVSAAMKALLGLKKPTPAGVAAVGEEADVLHYYYDLMKETLDRGRANDWPVAPWPGNRLNANFCIGEQDCGTSVNNPSAAIVNDHMGDKVHLMFPTGYVHGWKVALAALNIKAKEWNDLLVGLKPALYSELLNDCSATGGAGGAGCKMGQPFKFGVDAGGLNSATVSGIEANAKDFFGVTEDPISGYGLMDSAWKDIPSTMYSGGLLDMHAHSNMNGVMYTPGPLEWEPGNSNYDTGVHMSYVNGAVITGYGTYTKNKTPDDRYVLVFDMQAVDNLSANTKSLLLRRYNWQMLN